MKVAIVTDTHWGIRNDSPVFANYISKFFKEIFFPYIDEHKITNILHCGDVFDRRKFVNFQTVRNFENDFLTPAIDRNIRIDMMIGNHDTYYKNTNDVNSMKEIYDHHFYPDFNLYYETTEVNIGGCDMLFVPWICKENYDDTMNKINQTKAQVCFGHLELDGFELMKGHLMEGGMNPSIFNKFDFVASGHFHHKSQKGNIHYLGTAYELFWNDWNDPKGFHVFDTETRQLEFIENPNRMFHKIYYDDIDNKRPAFHDEGIANTYIKVIVKNKTNPYVFDLFMSQVERQQPAHVQVVDDHLHLDLESDVDIVSEAEDTMTILTKYIDGIDTDVPKDSVTKFVRSLYSQALSIQ